MSFELGVSYMFLMTMGWAGAHRFYNGRFWTGLLYAMTGGLCGIGIFLDFFLLPFMVNSAVDETYSSTEDSGGDVLEFVSRIFGRFAVAGLMFCILILAAAIVAG
tara:strand:- start:438 stop:752 length:315 start_codon:yes stop_codon:yes gene_type:complete